jgi:hypothetical protein
MVAVSASLRKETNRLTNVDGPGLLGGEPQDGNHTLAEPSDPNPRVALGEGGAALGHKR